MLSAIPTQFELTVQNNKFKFGAFSMRQFELYVKREKELIDAQDYSSLGTLRRQFVADAFNRAVGQTDITEADIAELDTPMFSAVYSEILKAQGIKPAAKVGETIPQ
jgi:hypothetical protein